MSPFLELLLQWKPLTSFYKLVHILNLILCFAKARRKKKIRKKALKRSTTIGDIQAVPNTKNIKILMNF